MVKKLLTEKEVEFLEEGPDAINPKNRWNYENRIKEKTTEGVSQILRRLPDLLPYLDAKHIQSEIDAPALGAALGNFLSRDQRRRVAATLLWGEKRPDESDQEFLERVPELVDGYESDISGILAQMQTTGESLPLLRTILERLRAQFETYIEVRRENSDISMAIPAEEVMAWSCEQRSPDDRPDVPALLEELRSPWDDGVKSKLIACRDILLSLGIQRDVISVQSDGTIVDQWRLSLPPTADDIGQYEAVIDALEEDVQALVEKYFEANQIAQKDALLTEALDVLDGPSRPEKDILEWDELRKPRAEWNGQHTRVANRWTGRSEFPLLSVAREDQDRREWEWTAFGEFVRFLWEAGIDRDRIEQEGLSSEIDEKLRQVMRASEGE